MNDVDSPVLLLEVENSRSAGLMPHKIKIPKIHDELCFEFEGNPEVVSELSILLDKDTIVFLQSLSPHQTLLKTILCAKESVADWPE